VDGGCGHCCELLGMLRVTREAERRGSKARQCGDPEPADGRNVSKMV
jgi:hypothetical protein